MEANWGLFDIRRIASAAFPFSHYDMLFLIDAEEIIEPNVSDLGFGKSYPDLDTLQLEFDNFAKNFQWFCSEYQRKHHKGIIVGRNCCETPFQEMLDFSWATNKNQLPASITKKLDDKNVKTGLVVGMHAFRCVDDFCQDNADKYCLTVISNLTFPFCGKSFEEEQREKEQFEEEQQKDDPLESESAILKFEESNTYPKFYFVSSFPTVFPQRLCIDQLPHPTPILNQIMKC